jgi:uncharacterized membrane protein
MYIRLYAIALSVFVALDMVWLGWVARDFYRNQIGFLMKTQVNWLAAVGFYLLFVVGLVVLAIAPAIEKDSWRSALLYGALFGFVSYATYDLSNLATLQGWPLWVTLVDMAWGATLAATVATATFFVWRQLGR